MNKTAVYALIIALLLPLVSYFVVKNYSEKAVAMPRHYLPDSVIVKTEKGKMVEDTLWHRVTDVTLTNQLGDKVTLDSLHGKIIIADFFFTHCPTICPPMTKNMKRLQESINNGKRVGDKTNKQVHFISFSIDPERDSVERLKYLADRFQVDPDQWWLLTGDKQTIYNMALNELKLGVQDGEGIDTSFVHSDKFVLIDTNRHVRGYYDGLDSVSLAGLSRDLVMLTMEKDRTKKSFLAGKLQMLAIVFLLAIVALGIFLLIFRKKKTHVTTGLEKE